MLKVGFARIDITPPLGINIAGYYEKRIADGILDPLLATAVVFDSAKKRAVLLSVDIIQMRQEACDIIRREIAEAVDTDPDGIYIAATHTHVGPSVPGVTGKRVNSDGVFRAAAENKTEIEVSDMARSVSEDEIFNSEYAAWLKKRLIDVSLMALADLAPAKLYYTHGEANDVSFIRRYRMKDGSIRTNPGWQNPDIVEPIGEADAQSSLIIIKREGKKEIGIVHFQVHPDLVGRTKFTADYPKFVRDTYEHNIPDSLCMYINGTQGDTNHIDVRRNPETDVCCKGYERAKYMGKKIAMSVLSNYDLAEEINGEEVDYLTRLVEIKYNKGTAEEIEESIRIAKIYYEKGREGFSGGNEGMKKTQMIAKATRIVSLLNEPDTVDLRVSVLRVGGIVFGGFPGEPFTEFGRAFKEKVRCQLALPTCLTNGGQGYYPANSAFAEGAYEANSTPFEQGAGEKLLEELLKMSEQLLKK